VQTLSRNALAAIGQVLASALLTFEQYRFLARELGAAQFGLWSLVLASASVARLSEFGLGSGVTRFVASDRGAGDPERVGRTVAIAVGLMGVIMAIVCWAAAPALHWGVARIVLGAEDRETAQSLIPYALAGLWLSSLANVFLSAIDGCLRTERRAAIVILTTALQLLACYILVPSHGVAAMGAVYVLQAALMLAGSVATAKMTIGLPWVAWRLADRERAWELVRYGGAIQAAAIGQLLFDPTIKVLTARFGGLGATGYYEMASRAVTQMRAIIVAAYKTLVPYIAHRSAGIAETGSVTKASYLAYSRFLFVVSTLFFAATAMALPFVLSFWLGKFNYDFVVIGLLCVLGWYANAFAITPYMWALALGKPAWIALSQLSIGILSGVFGLLGGIAEGALGAVGGGMLGLAVGSSTIIVLLHRHYRVDIRDTLPASAMGTVLICSGITAGCLWFSFTALSRAGSNVWPAALVAAVCLASSAFFVVVRHKEVKTLFSDLGNVRVGQRAPEH
jgi:O-antigen/teichoic acid export membrane protein